MVIATRMERMSRDADKRRSILASAVALLLSTEKQNEQRSETVFELVKRKTSCRKKNGKHRNANEPDANVASKHASMFNSLD